MSHIISVCSCSWRKKMLYGVFGTFLGRRVDYGRLWHVQACVLMVYLLKKYMHYYWKSLFHFCCVDTEVQICSGKDLGTGTMVSCSGSHFPSPNRWLPVWTPMLLEKQVANKPSGWVRIVSFSGNDLLQGHKFIIVWQHGNFFFLCAVRL